MASYQNSKLAQIEKEALGKEVRKKLGYSLPKNGTMQKYAEIMMKKKILKKNETPEVGPKLNTGNVPSTLKMKEETKSDLINLDLEQ